MSHHAPSKPYQVVMKLWFEPGGLSPVPSSDLAAAIIPDAVPMSEPPVFGEHGDAGDGDARILRDGPLVGVDVEDARTVGGQDRRLRGRSTAGGKDRLAAEGHTGGTGGRAGEEGSPLPRVTLRFGRFCTSHSLK